MLGLVPPEHCGIAVKALHTGFILRCDLPTQGSVCNTIFQQGFCLTTGLLQLRIKHQRLQSTASLQNGFQQLQHITAAGCIQRQALPQCCIDPTALPCLCCKSACILQKLLP